MVASFLWTTHCKMVSGTLWMCIQIIWHASAIPQFTLHLKNRGCSEQHCSCYFTGGMCYFAIHPLTIHITNVIWTDEACNILYNNTGIGICNFWSLGVKFVYIFWGYCCINMIQFPFHCSLIKYCELFSYLFNVNSIFILFLPSNKRIA